MIKIGLTGGIGSGKTTICHYFEQAGFCTLNLDNLAKGLMQPGQAGFMQVSALLGEAYLQNGEINRVKLRQALFDDAQLKAQVEAILHPLIRDTLLTQLAQQTEALVIIEIPLLVETQVDYVDYVIVVDCKISSQIARALQRPGYTEAHIQAIIEQQATRNQRLKIADWVIDSDQPLSAVQHQVNKIAQELYALSSHG